MQGQALVQIAQAILGDLGDDTKALKSRTSRRVLLHRSWWLSIKSTSKYLEQQFISIRSRQLRTFHQPTCLSLFLDALLHDPALRPFTTDVFDPSSCSTRHGSLQRCGHHWLVLLGRHSGRVFR